MLLLFFCLLSLQVYADFVPSAGSLYGQYNSPQVSSPPRSIPVSIPQQRKQQQPKSLHTPSRYSAEYPSKSGSPNYVSKSSSYPSAVNSSQGQRSSFEGTKEAYNNNIVPKVSRQPRDAELSEKEIGTVRKISMSYGKYLDVLIMNKKRGINVPQQLIQIASDKQYQAIHRLNELTHRQFDGHYPPGYTRQRWLDLRESLLSHSKKDPFNIVTLKINTGKSTYGISSSFSYQLRQMLTFFGIRFRHPWGNKGVIEIMNRKLRNVDHANVAVDSVFKLLIETIDSHLNESIDENVLTD